MKKLGKSILKDSMWSIAGIILMNVVAQFLIYPLWDKQLGSDAYGDILYLLSLMNIVAISLGTAVNYGRMYNKGSDVKNRSYLLILGGGTVVFQGTPEQLAAAGKGYTAPFIKDELKTK